MRIFRKLTGDENKQELLDLIRDLRNENQELFNKFLKINKETMITVDRVREICRFLNPELKFAKICEERNLADILDNLEYYLIYSYVDITIPQKPRKTRRPGKKDNE